ncbi:MAG: GWxTD domain-containing protein [Fimbriimonadaceae bacterium]|nr:GWxTD domain-containing protein [Chitinophagales bacterium]
MKKIILLCALAVSFATYINAQDLSTNVAVRNCVFYHPEQGNYVETYFTIAANVLQFHKTKNNLFQAGVEVQIMVMDGKTVASFDKYYLYSPSVADTTSVNFSIIEQKRLSIPNKALSIEIQVSDMNNPQNSFSATEALLPISDESIQISDIQFVDSYKQTTIVNAFTKNNYELQPYSLNFFSSSRNTIIFYGEVYNTEKNISDDQFLITYAIRSEGNDNQQTKFYQYSKFLKAPVVSFLKEFEISDLPSGNYNLIVEVRNKKNELITQKKTFIQRAKTGAVNYYENIAMVNTAGTFVDDYTEDQLNYFLDVIRPRATSDEAKLIESLSPRVEPDMKKKFLYNFWLERNIADPHAAFLEYLSLVKKANESFGTPSRAGYKTDRGRVYLEYGPPYDRIASASEPGAYPYEIWFYDRLPDKQTQIGFAFYEPSLVTNDYILLHSNARGELQDQRWKIKIYENVASPQEIFDLDKTEVSDKTGGHRVIDMYDF